MSNEQNQKPQSDKPLTRIRLAKVWLTENTVLGGTPLGGGVVQVIDCAPQIAPGRAYWKADYIPSWLLYEFTWYRDENCKPETYLVEKADISHSKLA